MEPIALSVKDAAKSLSLSKSRLYELISEGQIEARKIGGRTVIPYASLQALVASAPLMKEPA